MQNSSSRPKKYSFVTKIISLLMKMKLQTSISFRALALSFSIAQKSLGFKSKTPSHTTLLNWIHKIGYYELIKAKKRSDDWIIILDESIQLGQEKVLVILGIRESEINFTRPLQFQDLVPLREITKSRWNAEIISEILLDLQKELGSIKYAVGDYGSYLRKGIEKANIKHVHDLTHKIGLIIEKICKKLPDFMNLAMKIKKMRKKFTQTDIAFLKPPKLRSKCRYRNVMILSKWGMNIIRFLKNYSDDKKFMNQLGWILKYEELIKEYSLLSNIICNIEKIMKNNGLTKESVKQCKDILSSLNTESGKILKIYMLEYFNNTLSLLPNTKKILISSDIIESASGKYKNYVSSNPMAGITNLILCISAFTSSLKDDNIKEALENTTINDVKKWTKIFVGETLLKKRRLAFA